MERRFLVGVDTYIYRERERERERERDKRERERQERAKSAQLMQGRAKLATLGREVSILKVTLVPGSRRKQERATSVLVGRRSPLHPSSLTYLYVLILVQ